MEGSTTEVSRASVEGVVPEGLVEENAEVSKKNELPLKVVTCEEGTVPNGMINVIEYSPTSPNDDSDWVIVKHRKKVFLD